jgi:hypothetical protein
MSGAERPRQIHAWSQKGTVEVVTFGEYAPKKNFFMSEVERMVVLYQKVKSGLSGRTETPMEVDNGAGNFTKGDKRGLVEPPNSLPE